MRPSTCTYTHYIYYLHKLVHKRSATDFGNTQSAPRGGERERLKLIIALPLLLIYFLLFSGWGRRAHPPQVSPSPGADQGGRPPPRQEQARAHGEGTKKTEKMSVTLNSPLVKGALQ